MTTFAPDDLRSSIRQSYVICATPRSGSNFLCEVLQSTGVAGHPDEYFWNLPAGHERWSVPEFRAYVERIWRVGTAPNGVFGVKIMWSHLEGLLPRFAALVGGEETSPPAILDASFPNVSYIWLTRQDKVRQGVSFYRAVATDLWRSTDPDPGLTAEIPFDFEAIDYLVEQSVADGQAWKDFFDQHGLSPLEVVYEDLDRDPEGVARQVLQFLQFPPPAWRPAPVWRHQRQADSLTDAWVRRYHAVKGSDSG